MPSNSLYMGILVQLGYHIAFMFRGAAAAVIVFDITSKDSFAKAKSWIKELQRQVAHPQLCAVLPAGYRLKALCSVMFSPHRR